MSDGKSLRPKGEKIVNTMCASHCGGACLLRVHVKDGVITRIETDDGREPQLRGCLRGRAYRQRVYAPDRLLYPLKRVGNRGEGKFERISWDEALDKTASELKRVRDTYGPASIMLAQMTGDVCTLNNFGAMERLLNMFGGYTSPWGITSFHAGVYASLVTYGTYFCSNTRDDLMNSKLIIMWGWNPADAVNGTNTCWYLARAKEAGARIVYIDPRFTDSAATFSNQWIPIRPGTDTAMLLAMAYVMIKGKLHNQAFLDKYTIGFDKFRDYVMGHTDGVPKTPEWAAAITGVPAATIVHLAQDYAMVKPAALMTGIAPGRTGNGEQYHRAAIVLAAMTGNVGVHGGDAGARAWESIMGGFPYPTNPMLSSIDRAPNPVEKAYPKTPGPFSYRPPRIHFSKLADAMLKGKAGGYHADFKALVIAQCNYLVQFPNSNKIAEALKSLEFVVTEEQFMTPTAKFADIILPVATFLERNDVTYGVGSAYIGSVNKVIEPRGETKPPWRIAAELAQRMGIKDYLTKSEERDSGREGHGQRGLRLPPVQEEGRLPAEDAGAVCGLPEADRGPGQESVHHAFGQDRDILPAVGRPGHPRPDADPAVLRVQGRPHRPAGQEVPAAARHQPHEEAGPQPVREHPVAARAPAPHRHDQRGRCPGARHQGWRYGPGVQRPGHHRHPGPGHRAHHAGGGGCPARRLVFAGRQGGGPGGVRQHPHQRRVLSRRLLHLQHGPGGSEPQAG